LVDLIDGFRAALMIRIEVFRLEDDFIRPPRLHDCAHTLLKICFGLAQHVLNPTTVAKI
jgi:hypothetical protein